MVGLGLHVIAVWQIDMPDPLSASMV